MMDNPHLTVHAAVITVFDRKLPFFFFNPDNPNYTTDNPSGTTNHFKVQYSPVLGPKPSQLVTTFCTIHSSLTDVI